MAGDTLAIWGAMNDAAVAIIPEVARVTVAEDKLAFLVAVWNLPERRLREETKCVLPAWHQEAVWCGRKHAPHVPRRCVRNPYAVRP